MLHYHQVVLISGDIKRRESSKGTDGWNQGEWNMANDSSGWSELQKLWLNVFCKMMNKSHRFMFFAFYRAGHLYYYNQQEIGM